MNRLLLIIPILAFTLGSCTHCGGRQEASQQESVDTLPLLVMQIQKCSRLYTTEYHVHKIVTYDDVVRMQGTIFDQQYNVRLPLGDRKVAIPMDATLKAYIDFGAFTEDNVRRQGDRLTITLPDPQVVMTSSKIDQQNIKEYVSLTRAHFSDRELSGYEEQGRNAIIASIPRLGVVETARESAAKVLIPLFAQMGFPEENITVEFRQDMDLNNLKTLFDLTTIEKK